MPKNKGYLQRTLEFHKIYEEEIILTNHLFLTCM